LFLNEISPICLLVLARKYVDSDVKLLHNFSEKNQLKIVESLNPYLSRLVMDDWNNCQLLKIVKEEGLFVSGSPLFDNLFGLEMTAVLNSNSPSRESRSYSAKNKL